MILISKIHYHFTNISFYWKLNNCRHVFIDFYAQINIKSSPAHFIKSQKTQYIVHLCLPFIELSVFVHTRFFLDLQTAFCYPIDSYYIIKEWLSVFLQGYKPNTYLFPGHLIVIKLWDFKMRYKKPQICTRYDSITLQSNIILGWLI